MYKPQSLREHLQSLVRELRENPERLLLFIDQGRLRATAGRSMSFEYHYTLNVVVTDYAGEEDALMVPVLLWLKTHQPEYFQNPDLQKDGLTFEADLLNNQTADVSIKLALTERVLVKRTAGGLDIQHVGEPRDPNADVSHWAFYIKDELMAEWDSHPWQT